jgi:hypothetical protein
MRIVSNSILTIGSLGVAISLLLLLKSDYSFSLLLKLLVVSLMLLFGGINIRIAKNRIISSGLVFVLVSIGLFTFSSAANYTQWWKVLLLVFLLSITMSLIEILRYFPANKLKKLTLASIIFTAFVFIIQLVSTNFIDIKIIGLTTFSATFVLFLTQFYYLFFKKK